MHWRGVIKTYARAVEVLTRFSYTGQGVLGGVITCAMCVSDFGHKATCFVELVFLCFDNLMLEFCLKKPFTGMYGTAKTH